MKIIAWIYLVLLLISIAVPYVSGGPEARIYAVVLSAPWSLLLGTMLDSVGPAAMDAYGEFVPVVGGLMNFALILHLHRRASRKAASR